MSPAELVIKRLEVRLTLAVGLQVELPLWAQTLPILGRVTLCIHSNQIAGH